MSRLSFRLAPFAFLLTLVPAISTDELPRPVRWEELGRVGGGRARQG